MNLSCKLICKKKQRTEVLGLNVWLKPICHQRVRCLLGRVANLQVEIEVASFKPTGLTIYPGFIFTMSTTSRGRVIKLTATGNFII